MLECGKQSFEDGDYRKAIQMFSMVLGKDENNHEARQYLARSYYRDEEHTLAKEQFEILAKNKDGFTRAYCIGMVAAIKGIYEGCYDEAIEIFKSIPATINGTINFAITYNMKFKMTNESDLLYEAKKLLSALESDLENIPSFVHWRLFLSLGTVHHDLKNFAIAEKYYISALNSTHNSLNKGKILNEYANLHTSINKKDEALKILDQALGLIGDKSKRAIAYNHKYRARIHEQKGDTVSAGGLLQKAANIYKDRNILSELEKINLLLVELHNPDDEFYILADIYAETVFQEE